MKPIVLSFEIDEISFNEIKALTANDDVEIVESHNFSGLILVSVIVAVLPPIIKLLKLALEHEKIKRNTSITIGKDQISLSGFTSEEIQELIKIQELKDLINKIKQKK